jgi:hypothetical protein
MRSKKSLKSLNNQSAELEITQEIEVDQLTKKDLEIARAEVSKTEFFNSP